MNSKGKGPEAAPDGGYWRTRRASHVTEQRRERCQRRAQGDQRQITEGLVGLGRKISTLFSRSEVSELFLSKTTQYII